MPDPDTKATETASSTTAAAVPTAIDDGEPTIGGSLVTWLRGLGRGRNGDASLRESLEELIEEHDEAEQPINPEERLMLMNILKLGELRVDDVMVPRADIIAVEVGTALDDIVKLVGEAFHSRMPVYRDNLDDVLGMVHIKDLMRYWDRRRPFHLRRAVHEVLFVPPSMLVLDLMLKMRAARIHMAVVVDEYGGTDGLVTIEDLVEEIVGEIEDEHDQIEGPLIVERPDGSLVAGARAAIAELESRVGCDLLPDERDEEVDTLGGLVFSLVGRVPQRGEVVAHAAGLEFVVLDADPRRIKRIQVRGLPTKDAAAPDAADGNPGARD